MSPALSLGRLAGVLDRARDDPLPNWCLEGLFWAADTLERGGPCQVTNLTATVVCPTVVLLTAALRFHLPIFVLPATTQPPLPALEWGCGQGLGIVVTSVTWHQRMLRISLKPEGQKEWEVPRLGPGPPRLGSQFRCRSGFQRLAGMNAGLAVRSRCSIAVSLPSIIAETCSIPATICCSIEGAVGAGEMIDLRDRGVPF